MLGAQVILRLRGASVFPLNELERGSYRHRWDVTTGSAKRIQHDTQLTELKNEQKEPNPDSEAAKELTGIVDQEDAGSDSRCSPLAARRRRWATTRQRCRGAKAAHSASHYSPTLRPGCPIVSGYRSSGAAGRILAATENLQQPVVASLVLDVGMTAAAEDNATSFPTAAGYADQ